MIENRWEARQAARIAREAGPDPADRDLALEAYASRLIGADPDLVQHGGGNSSVKVTRRDLFGRSRPVLHVKGSGRDMARLGPADMPGLWLEPLLALRGLDRLSDRDMINAQKAAMLDAAAPGPSIETLLHAFLPHRFVNHSHATAMLALADLPEAEAAIAEIFGGRIGVVPFYHPGFLLGRAAADIHDENPDIEGLILLRHGHFSFGASAEEAYARMVEQTNAALAWLVARARPSARRRPSAPRREPGDILPVLRGVLGAVSAEHAGAAQAPMPVMDLRQSDEIDAFLARPDLDALSRRGVATPDHVIRIKNHPLWLDASAQDDIAGAVADFVDRYRDYFERNAARADEPKTLLDPGPLLAWVEGLGLVGIGADARAARIAADLGCQNIRAMTLGEDAGGFRPLEPGRIFDMEYWALEQAKLGRAAPPPFRGRVVLITGGAGAIGLATARAFAARGADIFLVDRDAARLEGALRELGAGHGGLALDITRPGAAREAMAAVTGAFGGLDILVSNAGAAWSGAMTEIDPAVLRQSFELNFFAHQALASEAAGLLRAQGRGGQLLFNISKQAVNPGADFGAYGLPKAATLALVRQLALELGGDGIRVNGINADRIRSGLLDAELIAERARARGVDEEGYMAGNILGREVEARHVAEGFVALARAERTTAHILTVDGGNIAAALR